MPKICVNCPDMSKKCVGSGVKCSVTKEELQVQIFETLRVLYIHEFELIKRNINEVCIASYFWYYFKNLYDDKYIDMNIDMEYNKCGIDDKSYYLITGEEKRRARPDFIIHKRSCNKNNFLYLEFKKNTRGLDNDYKKITAFTKQNWDDRDIDSRFIYKYRYGVSIVLGEDTVYLSWFEDGKKTDEELITVKDFTIE